ncbi:hypothetical protein [Clostridium vincentii]|uniref:hypothetical protein n=1 Tax=Clostridium vincentii TaxID=52704 RepID=UPI001475FB95|nr:hypothetical protein [Clostridium vincentii]
MEKFINKLLTRTTKKKAIEIAKNLIGVLEDKDKVENIYEEVAHSLVTIGVLL